MPIITCHKIENTSGVGRKVKAFFVCWILNTKCWKIEKIQIRVWRAIPNIKIPFKIFCPSLYHLGISNAYAKILACSPGAFSLRHHIDKTWQSSWITRALGTGGQGGQGGRGQSPPRVFVGQLTLFQPWRADNVHQITTCPPPLLISRPSYGPAVNGAKGQFGVHNEAAFALWPRLYWI